MFFKNRDNLKGYLDEEKSLMTGGRQQSYAHPWSLLVVSTCALLWSVSIIAAFLVGIRMRGCDGLARLPTDEITREAIRYKLTMLDDEFFATSPDSLRYMGDPRPELDKAWNKLLSIGFNFRVPREIAKRVNFTSIEIADGSGDLWATTAYNHNLHCIKYLRQAYFPEAYPATWEIMQPQEDGSISLHADHCLEKYSALYRHVLLYADHSSFSLRQSVLCAGDATLYHYYWDASSQNPLKPRASVRSPHVCIDQRRAQDWMRVRSFNVHEVSLLHPILGATKPRID